MQKSKLESCLEGASQLNGRPSQEQLPKEGESLQKTHGQ
jgi:hypothetical protein